MGQNNRKFRLRLNFFDCAVILIALAAAGLLLWRQFKPAPEAQQAGSVRYTIVLKQALEGTGELVKPGDALVDSVKISPWAGGVLLDGAGDEIHCGRGRRGPTLPPPSPAMRTSISRWRAPPPSPTRRSWWAAATR